MATRFTEITRLQLGEVIRSERERRGITIREAARRCGLSEAVLRAIETGRRESKDETLDRYAEVLGLEVSFNLTPSLVGAFL